MTNRDDVKKIVSKIRTRRDRWVLSRRPKNIQTLTKLAMTDVEIFNLIYQRISWQDYISGPELDNHTKPIPGDIWIFGLTIEGELCYLKIQDKPSGIVMWISVHIAAYPLHFPYK